MSGLFHCLNNQSLAKVADSLRVSDAGEAGPADVRIVREEIDEIFCFGDCKIECTLFANLHSMILRGGILFAECSSHRLQCTRLNKALTGARPVGN